MTRLGLEVLFLEDPDQPDRFHPRINLTDTALFRSLPHGGAGGAARLARRFLHRRHTRFWAEEAMKKLPVLMDASPMLICGEDLGMVPDSVPVVLKRLGLLSLEVQRWPKRLGQRFGRPAGLPLPVGLHDLDARHAHASAAGGRRSRGSAQCLLDGGHGLRRHGARASARPTSAGSSSSRTWRPRRCGAFCRSRTGWAIDARLRHPVAAEERINVPAIPRHYWRYRMHLTIEALLAAKEFNRSVAELVEAWHEPGLETPDVAAARRDTPPNPAGS